MEQRCFKGTAAAHTIKQADKFPEDHTQHHTQTKPSKEKGHKSAKTFADQAPPCIPKLATINAVRYPNRDPAATLPSYVAMPNVLTASGVLTACLYSDKDRADNPLQSNYADADALTACLYSGKDRTHKPPYMPTTRTTLH